MVSINEILHVFILSALPVSELRGGIPLAIYYGMNPVEAYLLCIAGNAFPVPFLLLFLEKIRMLAERWSFTSKFFRYIMDRTEKKKGVIEKYGYAGLTIFVAIPLPITGAWTGSLLAFILGLKTSKSFLFIFLGILIAGIIVALTSIGLISLF
jgi:uncharacterized membrane protein